MPQYGKKGKNVSILVLWHATDAVEGHLKNAAAPKNWERISSAGAVQECKYPVRKQGDLNHRNYKIMALP